MLTDEQKRRIEKTDREYDFGKKMSSSFCDTDLPDEAYDLEEAYAKLDELKANLPAHLMVDEDGSIRLIGA